jgi:cytochrome c oxidase assembly protein subunit 15
MGCPDWPRCFGSWVPPTSAEQLPSDYKEVYSAKRDQKNQKFIKYLRLAGMNSTANQLTEDKSILVESNFNAVKTWIEYVNRLTGVVIGLFILVLFWQSWKLRKISLRYFVVAGLTLLGVIFQGWFGSIVVSTNLTTWTITIHMLLALLIVALVVYLYTLTDTDAVKITLRPVVKWTLAGCMVLLLTQVILGTEVRSAIDRIAMSGLVRNSWIGSLGSEFILHRTFSWAVLIMHVILVVQIQKTNVDKALSRGLIVLILGTLVTGIGMAYFSIPAFLQPVHLLMATVTLGTQLLLFFRMNSNNQVVTA